MKVRFKICCIQNIEEALLAAQYGASAIGLVSAMPSGPGPIPEERIASIVPHVPRGVATFLLTSRQDSASIIAQQRRTRANTLQIVDEVSVQTYTELREALPDIAIVQVIHVLGPRSLDEALAVAPHVDGLLLDSGNPSLAVKVLGGTGRVHDWSVSREIVRQSGKPVFLAGGLHAGNVRQAIETVQPYAVDVCSGVRTNGSLDEEKLRRFVEEVKRATRS
ncbi:MAG: phosphoribosylanthranilate isomerase [Ignavibacterium sp.]|jgi:phosphoribosylanthranilate isomerase